MEYIKVMNLQLEIDLDASDRDLFVSNIEILGTYEAESYAFYFYDCLLPKLKQLNIDIETFFYEVSCLESSLYSYIEFE